MSEQDSSMGQAAGDSLPATGLTVGSPAPDFTLPDQDGKPVHLADFRGKSAVVLFFYPKDNSSGCTAEACAFRDSHEVFKSVGAEILGISSDSSSSHRDFASHHRLPYTLLSDDGGKVRSLYQVPRWLGIIPGRVTFVIDKQGIIRHTFNSMSGIDRHISESLDTLRALDGQPTA
jgi:thioredoxin-dependent peroxiredoxin